jgi:glycine/D-amino acid oxidase-like deaminating enzyme
MTRQVIVVGGGVIGAAIAYELSKISTIQVTLLDRQEPAQGSTGAALGILMGVISHKTKGRAWRMREASLNRYETLVPELESLTGMTIPYNRQGILMLLSEGADLANWDALISARQAQGWSLECWSREQVRDRCPQIHDEILMAGIYSPGDRQIDPTQLTLALLEGVRRNGGIVKFPLMVEAISPEMHGICIHTNEGELVADRVVLAAGLGSDTLSQQSTQPLQLQPVLGQALRLRLAEDMGFPAFQPVITGDDIHIVPLGQGEYWIGATVEFPTETGEVDAQAELLEEVLNGAIAFCPALAQGEILQTWSGLRPRPVNRPAPIVERLSGYDQVFLATGHYRNGVLLAPATAQMTVDAILEG